MGWISCHITPLVINSLRGTYTHTHTHTHTRAHTNFLDKGNLKKPDMHWPAAGMYLM